MLLLNRARLVNWHFFTDSTVDFGPTTLFAGDNGSGKSTVIDALQYALVANIGKIRFNAAASETRTGRTLSGYCRCRIGSDTLDFLRGDCLTHVILEFEDLEKSFCSGILVEAFADGETREHLWILEEGRIDDVPVYGDGTYLPPGIFKDGIKALGGRICSTKKEYNSRLTHLLKVHRRNVHFNPYLEALVRSVNFTPFTSVNDFVCSYILEERIVDISAMRENLANYKEAEGEARAMEEKIERLEEIDGLDRECRRLDGQILMQEYFKRRIDVEALEQDMRTVRGRAEEAKREIKALERNLSESRERRERLEGQRQELQFALAENDQHRLYERLSRDLHTLEERIRREEGRKRRFETLIEECSEALGRRVSPRIEEEIHTADTEFAETADLLAEAKNEFRRLKAERRDLNDELRRLEEGLLTYPSGTEDLRRALADAGIPAAVFADLLEVTDPGWRNAVEGWLGDRRFDLLVPEEDFSKALEVYRDQPASTAGAGLPDLRRMHGSEIDPGSLAECTEAATPPARRYMVRLLGDVVRTDRENLTAHGKSITRDCMRFADHTAVRIEESVYSRWYIGAEAKRMRAEQLKKAIAAGEAAEEKVSAEVRRLETKQELIRKVFRFLHECVELAGAAEDLSRAEQEKEEITGRISAIDIRAFREMQMQISGITESIRSTEREIEALSVDFGAARSRKEGYETELRRLTAERERFVSILAGFLEEYETRTGEFEDYYAERIKSERKGGAVDYTGIIARYESSMRGLKTRKENTLTRLMEKKNGFNHAFNIFLNTAYESKDFSETLHLYRDTELPEYREKIRRAREEAERQFREHFVARLNEYITDARESFKDINYTLNIIRFGQDQYRFAIEDRPEKRKVLDVIKSAAEIRQTDGTLFEILTDEEERESIERLFSSILENDLDSEEVREICDYRTYFQYDIRIKHLDTPDAGTGKPLESSLAKVLKEKSGGETQTPYYVAIAASFYRFYKDEPDAVRLVLFDEAFNKMDDERIGKMVDFFKRLNMQVITAVPTEKIEAIAPYMDRTNLVLRKDYTAFIRDYAVLPGEEG